MTPLKLQISLISFSKEQEICSVELESVQCNFFIFDHVTFIKFKICCCVQNFIKSGWFFTDIWRYVMPAKTSPRDIIPISLLKQCKTEMAIVLANLANISIMSGHFPTVMKEGIVVPLLKSLEWTLLIWRIFVLWQTCQLFLRSWNALHWLAWRHIFVHLRITVFCSQRIDRGTRQRRPSVRSWMISLEVLTVDM